MSLVKKVQANEGEEFIAKVYEIGSMINKLDSDLGNEKSLKGELSELIKQASDVKQCLANEIQSSQTTINKVKQEGESVTEFNDARKAFGMFLYWLTTLFDIAAIWICLYMPRRSTIDMVFAISLGLIVFLNIAALIYSVYRMKVGQALIQCVYFLCHVWVIGGLYLGLYTIAVSYMKIILGAICTIPYIIDMLEMALATSESRWQNFTKIIKIALIMTGAILTILFMADVI